MSAEPEQWQKDVEYLAKLADWAAGQGICQIEGLDDPEDWCLEAYDSFYPMRNGDDYSAQALADGLIASIQRAFEERMKNPGYLRGHFFSADPRSKALKDTTHDQ